MVFSVDWKGCRSAAKTREHCLVYSPSTGTAHDPRTTSTLTSGLKVVTSAWPTRPGFVSARPETGCEPATALPRAECLQCTINMTGVGGTSSAMKAVVVLALWLWPHKAMTEKCTLKGRTLDIAPLSRGTSLQKRSGMARVVDGFRSFTCTPTHLSTNEARLPLPCLPMLVFIYRPRRDERLSWPRHHHCE